MHHQERGQLVSRCAGSRVTDGREGEGGAASMG